MNENKVVFYFKPRNNMLVHSFGLGKDFYFTVWMEGDNPYIYKYEYHNNLVFGDPRLIWDISNDTYQYVIPTRRDLYGDKLGKHGFYSILFNSQTNRKCC